MDRLIDPATHFCRWMPLYVFYTAAPPAGYPVPPRKRGGCSARLAEDVRTTYGNLAPPGRATLTAARHLPNSTPWSSIFDGLVARLAQGQNVAAIVGSLANQKFPQPPTTRTIDQFWDAGVTGGACNGGLPAYAQEILARRGDDFDGAEVSELVVRTPGDALANDDTAGDEAQGDNLIPRRVLELGPQQAEEVLPDLPRFIAVIDIDRLPAGDLGPVDGLEPSTD